MPLGVRVTILPARSNSSPIVKFSNNNPSAPESAPLGKGPQPGVTGPEVRAHAVRQLTGPNTKQRSASVPIEYAT